MAKIIQVMTLQDGEYETITGLGSDGILYELKPYGEWAAISKALEEKVAPKLTYAKYEDDDHVELRVNGVRITTWETVDSTAEDQFKEFKMIFMAGYNAISTLDRGDT